MKIPVLASAALLLTGTLAAATASATPITYTLVTVADGSLNGIAFNQAHLTLTYHGDTRNVHSALSTSGGTVYTVTGGTATVSVREGGTVRSSQLAPGQVYVRYDTGSGMAGFGSPVSTTYPIVLGCSEDPTFASCNLAAGWIYQPSFVGGLGWNIGTLEGITDVLQNPADQIVYTAGAVASEPANLSQSTLLTGTAWACAGPETVDPNYGEYTCTTPAPRALLTILRRIGRVTHYGTFYLQDDVNSHPWQHHQTGSIRAEYGY